MSKTHRYSARVIWEGNSGTGTSAYDAYSRDHVIEAHGKPPIAGSSDPAFRGSRARWNPEQLMLAAISACHQLWYLHLCAQAGVIVTAYQDHADAIMAEGPDGGGQFISATLHPQATLAAGANAALAAHLHEEAHALCFIARSINFPVLIDHSFRTL